MQQRQIQRTFHIFVLVEKLTKKCRREGGITAENSHRKRCGSQPQNISGVRNVKDAGDDVTTTEPKRLIRAVTIRKFRRRLIVTKTIDRFFFLF